MEPVLGPHRAQAYPLIGSCGLSGIDDSVRPFPFLLGACPQVRVTASPTDPACACVRSLTWVNHSRCLNGVLNGNLGVIKSMIAELTDETNVARGFSLLPMARAVGYIIGYGMPPIPLPFFADDTP